MTFLHLVQLTVPSVVLLISTLVYMRDHRAKKYSDGKYVRIETPRHFASAYHLIQWAVLFGTLDTALPIFSHAGVLFESSRLAMVGLVFVFFGLALFLIAKRSLGKNYSPCFDAYQPFQVVSSGIYGYVRHPIYTANLIILLGVFMLTGHVLLLLSFVILFAYYAVSAAKEEQALSLQFPEYSAYKRYTHRFIPLLF